MTDEEVKDFATDLILDAATDIEWLTLFEIWDEWTGETLTEEDAKRVMDAIHTADVEVTW